MKRTIKLFMSNILIVILLFILFEIFIRLFYPEIKLPGTDSGLLQDSVYFDSQGLRTNVSGNSMGIIKHTTIDRTWKYSKYFNSKRRILFVGDSVTMGIGVEDDSTFCGIVNNTNDIFQIYNLSLIGYSVHDYNNILTKILINDKNHLMINEVIICWCLNDIYSNEIIQNLPQATDETLFGRGIVFIRDKSYLYQFIKNVLTDRAKDYFLFDNEIYTNGNRIFQKGIKDLENIISMMESSKIKFTILLLHYEFQLRNNNYSERDKPQLVLKKYLNRRAVKYYDLESAFRKHYENISESFLYGDGIHFSEKGHRIIAEYILNVVIN